MNQRERKLLLAMIAVGFVGVFLKFVYPSTIGPAFDYSAQLKSAQRKLDEAKTEKAELRDRLKQRYYEYVSRTGGTDLQIVEDDLLNSVNELIISSRLQSKLLSPRFTSLDKKTGIYVVTVSFDARGKFSECINFIRRFHETPYVARFETLKIRPTGNRGNLMHDECQIVGEMEALVMPAESPFRLSPGPTPSPTPRYAQSSDYYDKKLAQSKPFHPYVAPAQISTPTPTPIVVNTPPTPRPPSGPPSNRDAAQTVLRMIMRYGVDEVRTHNLRTKESEYISVGENLDEGELVLVHSLGAVVHKSDDNEDYGFFFYPIGETLDSNIPLEDARQWPEIQVAMLHFQREQDAIARPADTNYDPPAPPPQQEPLTGEALPDGAEPSASPDVVGPPAQEPAEDSQPSMLIDTPPAETPAPRVRPRTRLPSGSRPRPAPATQAADTQESNAVDESAGVESNNRNRPQPASPRIVKPINRTRGRPTPSPSGPK